MLIYLPCFYAQNPSSRDDVTGLSVECELTPVLLSLIKDMRDLADKHEVAVSAAPMAAVYSHNGVKIHAEGSQVHANKKYVWFTTNWKHIPLVSEPADWEEIGLVS